MTTGPVTEVPLPPKGPWAYWSGPKPTPDGEQVANAYEDFMDLTPVSQAAAIQTRLNWAALLPERPIDEVQRGSDG